MKLFGIEFDPLDESLEKRLQTFAVGIWIVVTIFMAPMAYIVALLLIIYTSVVRWFVILYFIWIYLIDWETCDRGGWSAKRTRWLRNLTLWRYCWDHFPIKIVKTADLDPSRNYLLCCFPHGLLSVGFTAAFCSDVLNFQDLFPGLRARMTSLSVNFKLPIFREYFYSAGICSASKKSITHVMTQEKTGAALALMVGGTAEALLTRPGSYSIVLKQRKGFVKVALEIGTPLVPVFCFGENDLYDRVEFSEESYLQSVQNWIQKRTGYALVMPIGRGLFQRSFGFIPRRVPLTIVVGSPLEVPKIPHPTTQQVDEYHKKFQDALEKLFETHKYKYVNDPENTVLNFE